MTTESFSATAESATTAINATDFDSVIIWWDVYEVRSRSMTEVWSVNATEYLGVELEPSCAED
jgi:hypothetical protein